jgi:hypothetical protein
MGYNILPGPMPRDFFQVPTFIPACHKKKDKAHFQEEVLG